MTCVERPLNARVQHIVGSYELAGDDEPAFTPCLVELLQLYPPPLVELALVEILVENWLRLPLPRGLDFLELVRARLQTWATPPVHTHLSAVQYYAITHLDPQPIFGVSVPQIESTAFPAR